VLLDPEDDTSLPKWITPNFDIAPKSKKNKKKRKPAAKATGTINGHVQNDERASIEEEEVDDPELGEAVGAGDSAPTMNAGTDNPAVASEGHRRIPNETTVNGTEQAGGRNDGAGEDDTTSPLRRRDSSSPTLNGRETSSDMTTARLDAMAQERETLREEVTRLRKDLEDVQQKYDEEKSGLESRLGTAEQEKEEAQNQYQSLLGRVNTLRSQLTERLKADAVRLATSLHCSLPALLARLRPQP
jgi:hypothetical protein